MYKECHTEKSIQRQIQIEECLVRQMQAKDYEQIHISDICREMGMSRNVFYRYFETKSDVLDAWLDRTVLSFEDSKWHTTITDDPRTESTRNFVRYWYDIREVTDLLMRQNMFDLFVQKEIVLTMHNPYLRRILRMDDDPSDSRRAFVFSAYGLLGIMRDWQQRGFVESEDEMIQTIQKLLTRPFYQP